MGLRANKKGRRRGHWQSKPGCCHQTSRSDPAGGDDLIGIKTASICLDTNDMTGRQIQSAHWIVRNDRRAKALRGGKQGLRCGERLHRSLRRHMQCELWRRCEMRFDSLYLGALDAANVVTPSRVL